MVNVGTQNIKDVALKKDKEIKFNILKYYGVCVCVCASKAALFSITQA